MTSSTPSIDLDRAIGFTLPNCHARGRAVRLGPVLHEILSAHNYPRPIEKLLAEALALTALLGALLKDKDGQLTLQAQTEGGIISLLVCDYRNGELRGYVQFDAERLATLGESPSLYALFGQGYLAITFDQAATKERYQGIVPLDGNSLSEAAEAYFDQSEQIPSLVRIGVQHTAEGKCIVGGLFLQHLPDSEVNKERLHVRVDRPDWDRVEMLGATAGADELADPALPLENLIWRLFNEEPEVRILPEVRFVRGCRCDATYIQQVLGKFSDEALADMADSDGVISVDCAFCSKKFPVDPRSVVSPTL